MTEAQHIALDKELANLFKKMSSKDFGVAKGANNQMLSVINRSLADNIVEKTVALEHREVIAFGGQQFGRVYDEVVEINGNPRYIDQKAWSSAYLDRGLKNELSFKVSATDGGNDQLGGLLKEIVAFEKNGRESFNARWDFSPEVGSADEIANKLKQLLDKDEAVKSNIEKVLGFETKTQWTEFVTTFDSKVREGFFKIEDYANLKAKLNL